MAELTTDASAKVRAQEILLSRTTHFVLSDQAWDEFQEALAAPPIPTKELVALIASKAPWGQQVVRREAGDRTTTNRTMVIKCKGD